MSGTSSQAGMSFSALLGCIDDEEVKEILYAFQPAIMETQKLEWNKARKKLDQQHMIDLRNVRTVCIKEITQTVKDYALESARQMTEEHRKIAKQFVGFKERTISHLNCMEEWHTRMKEAEQISSRQNPVLEGYYAMNDNTNLKNKNRALGLYDSLVPKLQAGSFRYEKYLTSINQKDILKEMQIEKLVNLDIAADDKQYNPAILKHKNRVLKFQLKTLQQNLEVVKWYIDSLEEGISGAEIMEKYSTLKKEHEKLEKTHTALK